MDLGRLGELLKDLRLKRGWSLRDAERATGLSNAYIYQLEQGDKARLPPADVLVMLASVYCIRMEELLAAAGYLERPEEFETEEDRIRRVYHQAIGDPGFKFGMKITDEPPIDVKRFIVEMYEQLRQEQEGEHNGRAS